MGFHRSPCVENQISCPLMLPGITICTCLNGWLDIPALPSAIMTTISNKMCSPYRFETIPRRKHPYSLDFQNIKTAIYIYIVILFVLDAAVSLHVSYTAVCGNSNDWASSWTYVSINIDISQHIFICYHFRMTPFSSYCFATTINIINTTKPSIIYHFN